MIRAAIFDLDGLLIDSEPLWRRGEAQVYRSLGMPVTEEEIRETTGLRMDEMLAYWYRKYPLPGLPPIAQAIGMVEQTMVRLTGEQGEPMPGAQQAVALAESLARAGGALGRRRATGQAPPGGLFVHRRRIGCCTGGVHGV